MDKNYYIPTKLTCKEVLLNEARKFIHAGTLKKGLQYSEISRALHSSGKRGEHNVIWFFRYMGTVVKIVWAPFMAEVYIEPNSGDIYDRSDVFENLSTHIEDVVRDYTEKYLVDHSDRFNLPHSPYTPVDDSVWDKIKPGTPVIHIPTGRVLVFKGRAGEELLEIFETLNCYGTVRKNELALFDNY